MTYNLLLFLCQFSVSLPRQRRTCDPIPATCMTRISRHKWTRYAALEKLPEGCDTIRASDMVHATADPRRAVGYLQLVSLNPDGFAGAEFHVPVSAGSPPNALSVASNFGVFSGIAR